MRRDDVDRLLIAGGLLWVLVAVGPGGAALVVGYPLLLLLAALLLWRDVAAVRPFLVVVALIHGVVLVAVAEDHRLGALLAIGDIIVAIGAARVRVPMPRAFEVAPAHSLADLDSPSHVGGPVREVADDPALLAFLDAVVHLGWESSRVLDAAWRAVDPAARERAWESVTQEAAATHRTELLDELRSVIEQWGRAAGGSPWTWEFGTMVDVDRGNLRRATMPALVDAAAAILLRDRLAPGDREVLAGPWESVVAATPTTTDLRGAPTAT